MLKIVGEIAFGKNLVVEMIRQKINNMIATRDM
jgi:hypothetical protein